MLAKECPKYADNFTNIFKHFKIQRATETTSNAFRSKNCRAFSNIQDKKRLVFFYYPKHSVSDVGIYIISRDL